jgi:hypothetical protein
MYNLALSNASRLSITGYLKNGRKNLLHLICSHWSLVMCNDNIMQLNMPEATISAWKQLLLVVFLTQSLITFWLNKLRFWKLGRILEETLMISMIIVQRCTFDRNKIWHICSAVYVAFVIVRIAMIVLSLPDDTGKHYQISQIWQQPENEELHNRVI